MRPRHVVARAHDDVEPGGPATRASASGIAGEPAVGRVHEGPAARVLEEEGLVARHLLVEELEVVEVRAEVVPDPAEVGQAHRLPGQAALRTGGGLAEHDREVDEEVLVGQGDAHRLAARSARARSGPVRRARAWSFRSRRTTRSLGPPSNRPCRRGSCRSRPPARSRMTYLACL